MSHLNREFFSIADVMSHQQQGFAQDRNPTPSRFLAECGAFNFTPGLMTSLAGGEMNPFEQSFKTTVPPPPPPPNERTTQREVTDMHPPPNITRLTAVAIDQHQLQFNLPEQQKQPQPIHQQQHHYNSSQHQSQPSESITSSASSNVMEQHPTQRKRRKRESTKNLNDEEKRQKFLERNRQAASKCRQKKKQWIEELEQKAEEATKRNEQLRASVSTLKDELIELKSLLLAHRNCECESIQQYIQSRHFNAVKEEAV